MISLQRTFTSLVHAHAGRTQEVEADQGTWQINLVLCAAAVVSQGLKAAAVIKIALITFVIAIAAVDCGEGQSELREPPLVRSRAEQLLELLRLQQWARATEYVLMNREALNRFALPPDAPRATIASRVEELFRELYEDRPPGPIVAVRRDPDRSGNTERALVSYRHGDLDAFYMRLVGDQWLYSFE